ncbi:MAG: ADP-forming succinate--CoA ligase subunit beta [Deltaproteobacteria bacterium]|nr:MAG: ADP-forming succinate--CoA ligase subunit beta [Deltaproteobacteria bacterium]
MKIHEYQAKSLFDKYGITVPDGRLCTTPEEARQAAEGFTMPAAVKAQIHAGGRGKGGGVKLAHNLDEVQAAADSILGMKLVTHQTGAEGRLVRKVLVEQGVSIKKELYLSLVPDRKSASITLITSSEGGMDIEEVADKTPEKIIRVAINPLAGMQDYLVREAAFGLGLSKPLIKEFAGLLKNLYRLFTDYDCSLLEINPLIITEDERLIALDAKVDIDSNSLFRHQDIREMHDPYEDDPAELEAAKFNLNYVKLDGNIGNMVNGAGLAMATMDIIKQAGAEPANFLDVGGGADADMIENGFRIILDDPNVKGILINIFGGILRCDILANGVVQAAKKVNIQVPVVVRMEGTNVEAGRKILEESGLELITAVNLSDAAAKVAAIVEQKPRKKHSTLLGWILKKLG